MFLNSGYQSFEFLQPHEVPKPMHFSSAQAALEWLKTIAFQDADLVNRLRDYLTLYSGDPESSRLTDYAAMERLALLLYSQRIIIVQREYRTGGGKPTAASESPAPAFPLAERSQRAPSSNQPAQTQEGSVFDPNIDPNAQADALVAAAQDGKPFCPE